MGKPHVKSGQENALGFCLIVDNSDNVCCRPNLAPQSISASIGAVAANGGPV
jgi:hypothetical protein